MLELAHIAWPVVGADEGQGLLGHGDVAQTVFFGALAHEMLRQKGPVGAPLPQGGDGDGQHIQAVIEIGAELALLGQPGHIAVGGGDDPCRHRPLPGGADLAHNAPFQHRQELGLQVQGQFTDLVHEQHPIFRRLDQTGARGVGAGEGAFFVAEQLGLDQVLGQAGAIHMHKGPLAAGAVGVQQPGHHILARSRLAKDQHGGRR